MMHHGILHTWPIFTITTTTGVNTQKCVGRKIQHYAFEPGWTLMKNYNYITIIPKVGNTIYYIYSRQNTQEI